MPDASTPNRPPAVALLGGTGFIGTAVAERVHAVRSVTAPRLRWLPRPPRNGDPSPEADEWHAEVERLAETLRGSQIVVNAAGIADPAARAGADLYGANALLPFLIARACALAGVRRFIHVSSIAVQGDGPLDETPRTTAFSPYSHSRAVGERLLLSWGSAGVETVIFRPTSVHGPERAVTRSVVRLARSPLSCVAGDGSAATPQVLVSDVAASIARLVAEPGPVPPIVLQPANGMTTGLLLRLLGGREPRHLPGAASRAALRCVKACAVASRRAHAHARRADMLLLGREQVPGWLDLRGAAPVICREQWEDLAVRAGLNRST